MGRILNTVLKVLAGVYAIINIGGLPGAIEGWQKDALQPLGITAGRALGIVLLLGLAVSLVPAKARASAREAVTRRLSLGKRDSPAEPAAPRIEPQTATEQELPTELPVSIETGSVGFIPNPYAIQSPVPRDALMTLDAIRFTNRSAAPMSLEVRLELDQLEVREGEWRLWRDHELHAVAAELLACPISLAPWQSVVGNVGFIIRISEKLGFPGASRAWMQARVRVIDHISDKSVELPVSGGRYP